MITPVREIHILDCFSFKSDGEKINILMAENN